MNNLQGQVGELTFNIQITRKETGKVEDYTMTSAIDADQLKQLQDANLIPKENDHGSNA